jgi:hypothetical protein
MGTLRKYRLEESKCEYFIETGTGLGHSLLHAAKQRTFRILHSSEIHKQTYIIAKQRFSNFKNVFIHNKSSSDFLKDILAEIPNDKTCLFYLDAHFPGEVSTNYDYKNNILNETSFPLIDELNIIKEIRAQSNDIIIVDDLCLLEEGDFENGNIAHGFANIFNKVGTSIIEKVFHDRQIIRDYRDEGYLLIIPKNSSFKLMRLSWAARLKRSIAKNFQKYMPNQR